MAGHWRPEPLVKTLSGSDIHQVLDAFGQENEVVDDPLVGADLLVQREMENGETLKSQESQVKFYASRHASTLQQEWHNLFDQDDYFSNLQRNAFNGSLGTKSFRSICWRLFWECLPEERSCWVEKAKKLRDDYNVVRSKYVVDPYEQEQSDDLDIHHPLSQAEESVWHKYFQDKELRTTIMQDLDRLFPEIEFFQKDTVKSVMLHILFCYARENPQLSYRQGMHEILAPVLYVMLTNCAAVRESTEDLSEEIRFLLDLSYVESDAYVMFSRIMDAIEIWYVNNKPNSNVATHSQDISDRSMFQKQPNSQASSAISKKLDRIQGYMLKRYDAQLADHMRKLDIAPQLYGLRWIRLLFGREFSFNRLLSLWDALFADGAALDLVDYVYLAMLINLRGVLLQNDFATSLSCLMRYPVNTDTKYILRRAVWLRESKPSPAPGMVDSTKHRSGVGMKPVRGRGARNVAPRLVHKGRHAHPVLKRLERQEDEDEKETGGRKDRIDDNQVPESDLTGTSNDSDSPKMEAHPDSVVDSTSPERKNSDFSIVYFEKAEANRHPTKSSTSVVASQISHLKTKVASSSQVLSRIARSRTRSKDGMSALEEDHHRLQRQVSDLQSQLDKLQSLSLYCAGKVDTYVVHLQERLVKDESFNDEVAFLCLAGLKQVRDVMRGSLESKGSTTEQDIDFSDIDKYINQACEISGERGELISGAASTTKIGEDNHLPSSRFVKSPSSASDDPSSVSDGSAKAQAGQPVREQFFGILSLTSSSTRGVSITDGSTFAIVDDANNSQTEKSEATIVATDTDPLFCQSSRSDVTAPRTEESVVLDESFEKDLLSIKYAEGRREPLTDAYFDQSYGIARTYRYEENGRELLDTVASPQAKGFKDPLTSFLDGDSW